MNFLMICLIIWHWGKSLSQIMIIKPTEVSKRNILRTIKAQARPTCWIKCRQSNGCETIGTDPENEKIKNVLLLC